LFEGPDVELLMRRLIVALLVAVAPLPTAAKAPPPREALVKVQSKFPVKETLDRLVAEIERRGLKVAVRIDHAAGAKAAGMELPPTEVLLFGNPKLGTPLMQSNPAAGIDLPMKVLAWQDKAGKVWIGYNAPVAVAVAARHAIRDRAEVVKSMSAALSGLVKAASGQP
jgi:uncharacterized protein (DUF302 family)